MMDILVKNNFNTHLLNLHLLTKSIKLLSNILDNKIIFPIFKLLVQK